MSSAVLFQVFTGDSSSQSFKLSGLRPGVKYSVRARVRQTSPIADSNCVYSAFSRVAVFTMPTLQAASGNGSGDDTPNNKSPKAPASSSSSPSSGVVHRAKHQQRGKKPPKTVVQTKSAVVSNDQRQAIFILVVFGVVTVLVGIAVALYFFSQ